MPCWLVANAIRLEKFACFFFFFQEVFSLVFSRDFFSFLGISVFFLFFLLLVGFKHA